MALAPGTGGVHIAIIGELLSLVFVVRREEILGQFITLVYLFCAAHSFLTVIAYRLVNNGYLRLTYSRRFAFRLTSPWLLHDWGATMTRSNQGMYIAQRDTHLAESLDANTPLLHNPSVCP